MKNSDTFWLLIRELLYDSTKKGDGDFRLMVLSRMQEYSKDVAINDDMSVLFAKLCDIALDCQFSALPEDAFKVVVATLLHENGPSATDLDDFIGELTGFDKARLKTAKDFLSEKVCLEPTLASKITGIRKKKSQKRGVIGFEN